MNKKRKILLIGPVPPNSGGVSVHLQRLLQKSKDYGDLQLAVFDPQKKKLFYSDRSPGNIFSAMLFFMRSEIVHIHVSHSSKVFIARLSKFLGKKVVYTQHNRYKTNLPSTKAITRIADKVIYVFEEKNLPENAVVLPAYIPTVPGSPLPTALSEELKKFRFRIVSVSSYPKQPDVEDVYGFDLILDAVQNSSFGSETALVFVDSMGAMKIFYSNKITEAENKSGIKIFYVDSELNFTALLSESTVFIRATRNDGDSLSVREALNAGISVLASDCVSRPEGCILFRSNDIDDLSNKLNIILQNPSRKKIYQEDFSQKLFQIYTAL